MYYIELWYASYDRLCLCRHQSDQGKALKIIGLVENGLMEWNTMAIAQQWEVQRSKEGRGLAVHVLRMKICKQCIVV